MYMYIYIYIHMYVNIYAHMYTYIYRCTYIHVHICKYTYICVHTHRCTEQHMQHRARHGIWIYVYTYIHIYTYSFSYTHVYIYIHTNTHTHTWVCVCVVFRTSKGGRFLVETKGNVLIELWVARTRNTPWAALCCSSKFTHLDHPCLSLSATFMEVGLWDRPYPGNILKIERMPLTMTRGSPCLDICTACVCVCVCVCVWHAMRGTLWYRLFGTYVHVCVYSCMCVFMQT